MLGESEHVRTILKMLGISENVGRIWKCWENLKMLGKFYIARTWAVQF